MSKKYICESCGSVKSEDYFFCSDVKTSKCKEDFRVGKNYEPCNGTFVEVLEGTLTNMESIQDLMCKTIQKQFDDHVLPLIKKDMRKLKISRIKHAMGVTFFTVNGKVLSESEFETTTARRKFYSKNVLPWLDRSFYNIINSDIG